MHRRPLTKVALALLSFGLVSVACATHSGTELSDPTRPDVVVTTAPPAIEPQTTGLGGLSLASPAFAPGGELPFVWSVDGGAVSPELEWSNVPNAAAELAIVVVNADADDFTHWVVAGLDPRLTGVELGALPPDAVEFFSDVPEPGWYGLDTPPGGNHRYVFTLYALNLPLGLDPASTGLDVPAIIAERAFTSASVSGVFSPAA